MKRCRKCGMGKALSDFYVRTDTGKPSSWCRMCMRSANYERRARSGKPVYNPDVDIWSHRRRKYGLSKAQFMQMLTDQDGRCAICERERRLVVDHDHVTGQIRGLLCVNCNWALGHMRDDPDWLNNAITYLMIGRGADQQPSS